MNADSSSEPHQHFTIFLAMSKIAIKLIHKPVSYPWQLNLIYITGVCWDVMIATNLISHLSEQLGRIGSTASIKYFQLCQKI